MKQVTSEEPFTVPSAERLQRERQGAIRRSHQGTPATVKFTSPPLKAGLLRSFGTVNSHRNGDKSGEILNQNCGALGLNYSLRRPITEQSANCALRGACHLGQVLARQVDPRASGRTLALQ